MSDITMCSSINCTKRDNCYRATAKASKWQSWSNFECTCNENNGFEDFIKRKNKKPLKTRAFWNENSNERLISSEILRKEKRYV